MEPATSAPILPLPITLFVTAASFMVLLLAIRRAGCISGVFALCAIWLRIMSGAYHPITYAPIGGSLSVNALISVMTVMAGLVVLAPRELARNWCWPFYYILACVLVSAAMNKAFGGAVDMMFKWAYALVLIAAITDFMRRAGYNRALTLIALCYAPILPMQFASVILGLGKATEKTGSDEASTLSYIGGYYHEANFSIMLVSLIAALYFTTNRAFTVKLLYTLVGIVSIILANYRTCMIAVLPLIAGIFLLEGSRSFNRKSRGVVLIALLGCAVLVMFLVSLKFAERFADIGTVLDRGTDLIKPQDQFSPDERRILSGRLSIWSGYIFAYAAGDDWKHAFGFGPNTWSTVFRLYAHNTLIHNLYELGIFGAAGILALWTMFVVAALCIQDGHHRMKALFANAGWLLLNQATMPHWSIEGNILFAVIQASTLYNLSLNRIRVSEPVLKRRSAQPRTDHAQTARAGSRSAPTRATTPRTSSASFAP